MYRRVQTWVFMLNQQVLHPLNNLPRLFSLAYKINRYIMDECWFGLTREHRFGTYYDSLSVKKKKKLSVLNK